MKKLLPPTYFWLAILLSLLTLLLPLNKIISFPYTLLGVLLIIFGSIINIVTDNLFKEKKTTVKPNEKPSLLVVSGPFRLSRHPMYIGMVSIQLGVAILVGNVLALLFPLLFALLMNYKFIPLEEKNLETVFGKEYLNYKKKRRKWI